MKTNSSLFKIITPRYSRENVKVKYVGPNHWLTKRFIVKDETPHMISIHKLGTNSYSYQLIGVSNYDSRRRSRPAILQGKARTRKHALALAIQEFLK